jgi:hypothetical protein
LASAGIVLVRTRGGPRKPRGATQRIAKQRRGMAKSTDSGAGPVEVPRFLIDRAHTAVALDRSKSGVVLLERAGLLTPKRHRHNGKVYYALDQVRRLASIEEQGQ